MSNSLKHDMQMEYAQEIEKLYNQNRSLSNFFRIMLAIFFVLFIGWRSNVSSYSDYASLPRTMSDFEVYSQEYFNTPESRHDSRRTIYRQIPITDIVEYFCIETASYDIDLSDIFLGHELEINQEIKYKDTPSSSFTTYYALVRTTAGEMCLLRCRDDYDREYIVPEFLEHIPDFEERLFYGLWDGIEASELVLYGRFVDSQIEWIDNLNDADGVFFNKPEDMSNLEYFYTWRNTPMFTLNMSAYENDLAEAAVLSTKISRWRFLCIGSAVLIVFIIIKRHRNKKSSQILEAKMDQLEA